MCRRTGCLKLLYCSEFGTLPRMRVRWMSSWIVPRFLTTASAAHASSPSSVRAIWANWKGRMAVFEMRAPSNVYAWLPLVLVNETPPILRVQAAGQRKVSSRMTEVRMPLRRWLCGCASTARGGGRERGRTSSRR